MFHLICGKYWIIVHNLDKLFCFRSYTCYWFHMLRDTYLNIIGKRWEAWFAYDLGVILDWVWHNYWNQPNPPYIDPVVPARQRIDIRRVVAIRRHTEGLMQLHFLRTLSVERLPYHLAWVRLPSLAELLEFASGEALSRDYRLAGFQYVGKLQISDIYKYAN